MNGAKVIISKELKRVFGDKKLIFSLFILPAVLVIGIYALMGFMMDGLTSDIEKHVGTVYIQNAPQEVKDIITATGYDKMVNLTYLEEGSQVDEIESAILAGDSELLVTFEKGFMDFAKSYAAAGDHVPSLEVAYNSTVNYSSAARSLFSEMVLSSLEHQMMVDRFQNLELLTVFDTQTKLIVNEDKANSEFASMMLPYFITFMLFAGAMSLGVDAIAGEKERGTMASMLLSPIKRQEIVVGKLVSLAILSSISAVVYAGAMVIAMPMMGDFMNGATGSVDLGSMKFDAIQIIELLAIMLAMVYLYVAVVAYVSVLAKNSKEANTYVSPIYIVVMLCGLLTIFMGGMEKKLQMFAIPIYGNALAIQNILNNELSIQQFLLSFGGTVLCGILFTALLTKAFNSEKVMFNA